MEKCGQQPMGATDSQKLFIRVETFQSIFVNELGTVAAERLADQLLCSFSSMIFIEKLWNFNVHSVWVMRSFPFIDWWLVFTFLDTILTQDSMDMCVDCGFYVCSKPHSMEIMKWFDSRMRNDHHQIFIRYYKWGLQGKELSKCASKTWDYSHQNFVCMQKITYCEWQLKPRLIRSSSALRHDIVQIIADRGKLSRSLFAIQTINYNRQSRRGL